MTEGKVQQEHFMPSRISASVFWLKSSLLKIKRTVQNTGAGLQRWPAGDQRSFPVLLVEERTPLWSNTDVAERELQQGKVQNLRCAVRFLRHVVIPAGGAFSFWQQIGRATRQRGYVPGRQIQEGCIVPAVGGGLCQLSNALYDLALRAGCEIIERHPHTRVVPGSAAAMGRDATVYWNYLDLRFRPVQTIMLDAHLTADMLVVRLYVRQTETNAGVQQAAPASSASPSISLQPMDTGRSCLSCGVEACFRHRPTAAIRAVGRASEPTTYLLDEWSLEFALWLRAAHTADDRLGIPIDGRRRHLARYAWETDGYERVCTATWEVLRGSFATRRLAGQGAARQQAQMRRAEALAGRLAQLLRPDSEHVCVA